MTINAQSGVFSPQVSRGTTRRFGFIPPDEAPTLFAPYTWTTDVDGDADISVEVVDEILIQGETYQNVLVITIVVDEDVSSLTSGYKLWVKANGENVLLGRLFVSNDGTLYPSTTEGIPVRMPGDLVAQAVQLAVLPAAVAPSGEGPPPYVKVQSTPALVWVCQHNFGHYPGEPIIEDADGHGLGGEVTHLNTNVVLITYFEAVAGRATFTP